MKKLRILIVSDGPSNSPLTNSGVALGISTALRRSGSAEIVDALDARPKGLRRVLLMLATVRPTRNGWWANFNLGMRNIRVRSRMRDRKALGLYRAGNLDVVLHVRNIYLPAPVPYVAFIDSTSAMANEGWAAWRPNTERARKQREEVERKYYRGALCVFTAGPQAARSVMDDYGVPESRVRAVGGGVNFDPLPLVMSRRSGQRVLWVGLDFERKGGDLLLAAFRVVRRRFPNAELVFAGATPPSIEPGVTAAGVVRDRVEMAELYRNADIFCLPARHEPYGLVVQEAMAFGLPCVVTETGALSAIVEDGETGRVVAEASGEGIADALIELLSDSAMSTKMGAAGRAKVERELTWSAVASRILDGIPLEGETRR